MTEVTRRIDALAGVIVLAVVVLGGCARATLPYTPEQQPRGARVSAAYQVVGDRLGIEIDTDGRLLEQAWILKPDGTSVPPHAVDAPPLVTTPPPTVGVGVGGGTTGRRTSVGGGVGMSFPFGGGSTSSPGTTIAWFPLTPAGPPPWRVYVKLAGTDPTTIIIGAPRP
jgi:uncharacterized membrane protein YgcG